MNQPHLSESAGITTFRGGLRHGSSHLLAVNFTWPFATLEIGPRELTLRGPGVHYVFSREGVAIEDFRGIFSPGLRFLPTDPAVPPQVVFWTFQPRAVKAALAAHGYAVAAAG
ncbi:hypothetical protein DB345_02430 [Spartobacteria bacterium LR76]|nr:hypothetical protein DB345_02430 [Spartobacteria bacterium LR76]